MKPGDIVISKELDCLVQISWINGDRAYINFIPSGTGGCWRFLIDLKEWKPKKWTN